MNISRERVNAYKGLCAIAILIHHIEMSTKAMGGVFSVFLYLSYTLTGLFFFFSGYGLYISFTKKENYLKNYLKRRIPKLYLPFFAVCVVTTIAVLFITKEKEKYSPIILRTFGIRLFDFANSWFVWAIIAWSLVFYFLFKFVKNKKLNLILMLAGSVVFSVVCLVIKADRYIYTSTIAFPLGIAFVMYGDKLEKFYKKSIVSFISSAFVFAVGFTGAKLLKLDDNRYILFVFQTVALISFLSMMIAVIRKIKLENKVTEFFGDISYYVYLYHGVVMHTLSRLDVTQNHYIFSILTLIITIIISFASQKIQLLITKNNAKRKA